MKENEIKTAGVILHNSAPEELAQACVQWQKAEKESRGALTVIFEGQPDGNTDIAVCLHGDRVLFRHILRDALTNDAELARLILSALSEALADTMTHQSNK